MLLTPEQKRSYVTLIHVDHPEIKTQYGHYRVRLTFDDALGVFVSACDQEGNIIGETLIKRQDYDKMQTTLSLGWAYDRALVWLERCALEAEGFFTNEGTAE